MSLRTIPRWMVVSALALGGVAVSGCDDEESLAKVDAGTDGGAGLDSSTPSLDAVCEEDPEMKACKGVNVLPGVDLNGCCTEDKGLCGLDMDGLKALLDEVPFEGCLQRAQEGVPSGTCTEMWERGDATEPPDGKPDGFSFMAGQFPLSFAGCCRPEGQCGLLANDIMGVQLGLGCLSVDSLANVFPDGGVPDVARIPCQPSTGDVFCPETLSEAMCAGLTAGGIACTPGADTPDWICQSQGLIRDADSGVPVEDTCMEGVPEFVRGCGLGIPYYELPKGSARCIDRVADTVFGCEAVTMGPVPNVPEYLCGCGERATSSDLGVPCLANVPRRICGMTKVDTKGTDGKADTDDDCAAGLPEYAQGCGDTEQSAENRCFPNLERVYGCANVVESPNLPEYMCGCGENKPQSPEDPFCLANVDVAICGSVEVTTPPAVPSTFCGCGDGERGDGCLDNVPKDVCGSL